RTVLTNNGVKFSETATMLQAAQKVVELSRKEAA
ncbi:unnamed protein product, partial [marine sediment metagenome]